MKGFKDQLRIKKLEKVIDTLVDLNRTYKGTDAGMHINQSLQSAVAANKILREADKNIR
jgi:hypothetical protein